MPYDAFISYSQAADGRLAPAVQHGLQRLARTWYRRRALHVFRDDTGLSATPDLWASIQRALDDSRAFIVLASPEAAASRWVAREIDHWRSSHGGERLLVAITGGEWAWDDEAHDFDWERSSAIPRALAGAFADEPKVTDLRWARDEIDLDLRNARFRRSLADLAAPLHGVTPDDIEGEDIRQHRRFRRIARATVATLGVLVVLTSAATVLALRSRDQARDSARVALARSLAQSSRSEDSPRLGALLALEALKRDSAPAERSAALEALALAPSSGAVLRGTSGAVTHVEFGPRGTAISSGVDGYVRFWNPSRGTEERAPLLTDGEAFARLPRHSGIVFGRQDGSVKIFIGAKNSVQQAHAKKVVDVAVSGDESVAATAGDDGTIVIWSLPAARRIGAPIVAQGVSSIAFAPSGRVLYSVGDGGTLRRWDVASHAEIGSAVRVSRFSLSAVAVNPASGVIAAAGGERRVFFRDAEGGPVGSPALTAGGAVRDISFSRDGRHLAVGESSGMVEIWSAKDNAPVNPPLTGHTGVVTSVAFSEDGRLLASAADDGTVRIWRVGADGLATVTARGAQIVWGVALDPTGTTVAEASFDGSLHVWSAKGGDRSERVLRAAKAGTGAYSVAFDATARVLADGLTETIEAGRARYVAEAWDLNDGDAPRWRRTLKIAKPGGVVRVAVGPDGSFVAANAGTPAVELLDARTGAVRRSIETGSDVLAIDLSPDGSTLATSHFDRKIRLWRVSDGHREQVLSGPSGLSFSLAFSHGGDQLAASDQGAKVSLWVASDGRFAPRRLLALHPGAMSAVTFSPDDATLAATGADGVLALWDVASGELFAELPSGGAESFAVDWEGGTLVTGMDRGLVATWDAGLAAVDLARTTSVLCGHARPHLTREEWERFLPGQDFDPAC